jgi:two-component system response regulator YesN
MEQILKNIGQAEKVLIDDRLVIISKGCTYESLKNKLIKNNDRLKQRFGEGFFIAIGHNVTNWEDICYSYECAKLLSSYEFLYKDYEAVCIDIFLNDKEEQDIDYLNRICGFIEIGDIEEISEIVEALKEYYRSKLMRESEIKVQITHNMVMLNNILEQRYSDKKGDFPDFKKVAEEIKNADSLSGLMDMMNRYCSGISECIGTSSAENVVKRMVAYMEKHYDQDLKLEGIAKIFNYNSAYLGKIFKKEMKESFNNVLDFIRIENAKRLLLQSDLKVYQISEMVGYSNIDYFYLKFKKHVGFSPKEFKKQ